MRIISSVELRDMQGFATVVAGFAKKVMDGAQQQMQANGASLPPSEIAMVSIAASLSVIAAVAIKQLEQIEKADGKETKLQTEDFNFSGTDVSKG